MKYFTFLLNVIVFNLNLISKLETRLPVLRFRGVKIMQKQNVFGTSNFNVHFKNENISANIPCQNNAEYFRHTCFAVLIETARREPQLPVEITTNICKLQFRFRVISFIVKNTFKCFNVKILIFLCNHMGMFMCVRVCTSQTC